MTATRPFIDAHAHLFPDRLLAAIWRFFREDGYQLWHEGDTASVARGLLASGAERLFLLCYAHRGGVAAGLNAWLHETARQEPRFVPFGAAHPDDPDMVALAERCFGEYGFAGLKLHCSVQRLPCDDPRLDPLYDVVQARGKAVVIHAGSAPYDDPYTGLAQAERLASRHPDLKVVFAHLGVWDVTGFARLAERHANVYLDCSSVLVFPRLQADARFRAVQAEVPAVLTALSDKVFWGSDYPFLESSYEATLAGLDALPLAPAVAERVRYGNARAFLQQILPAAVPGAAPSP